MTEKEQYIKMSNCPEIQGGWVPKVGDLTNAGIIDIIREGIIYLSGLGGNCYTQNTLKWLPRQGQLQDMVVQGSTEYNLQLGFNHWLTKFACSETGYKPLEIMMFSMRQLWLAFVMWKLHKKKWNGTEWYTEL